MTHFFEEMPILLQLFQQKCVPFQGEIHWEVNFYSNLFAFSSRKKNHFQFYWREEEPVFASPTANGNAPNKRPQRETEGIIKTHIQTSHINKIQNKIHVAAPAATGSAAIRRDEHLGGMQAANPSVEEWSPSARRGCGNVLWLAEPGPVRSWAAFARCYLRAPGTEGWKPWSPQTASCRFRSLKQYKTYLLHLVTRELALA